MHVGEFVQPTGLTEKSFANSIAKLEMLMVPTSANLASATNLAVERNFRTPVAAVKAAT